MKIKANFRTVYLVIALLIGVLTNLQSYAQEKAYSINSFDASTVTSAHDLQCLAMNIYHEGRGEPSKGQAAIASVTMNRVRSKIYPNSVCAVVWQHKQFSWTQIDSRHLLIDDAVAWKQALVVAQLFLNGATLTQVGNATHFHADYVKPYWIADNKLVGKIGKHYFYIL